METNSRFPLILYIQIYMAVGLSLVMSFSINTEWSDVNVTDSCVIVVLSITHVFYGRSNKVDTVLSNRLNPKCSTPLLLCDKSLYEPMLAYCQLDPRNKRFQNVNSNSYTCIHTMCSWKITFLVIQMNWHWDLRVASQSPLSNTQP